MSQVKQGLWFDALEDVDDPLVELRAAASVELGERLAWGEGLAEDARPDHRIERVGDGDDARAEPDAVAARCLRESAAVGPLMGVAHDRGRGGQVRHPREERAADRRVRADEALLLDRERRRLAEQRVR